MADRLPRALRPLGRVLTSALLDERWRGRSGWSRRGERCGPCCGRCWPCAGGRAAAAAAALLLVHGGGAGRGVYPDGYTLTSGPPCAGDFTTASRGGEQGRGHRHLTEKPAVPGPSPTPISPAAISPASTRTTTTRPGTVPAQRVASPDPVWAPGPPGPGADGRRSTASRTCGRDARRAAEDVDGRHPTVGERAGGVRGGRRGAATPEVSGGSVAPVPGTGRDGTRRGACAWGAVG